MFGTSFRTLAALIFLFSISKAFSTESESLHAMFWMNGGSRLQATAGQPTVLEMAVHAPDDSDHEMPGMPGMSSEWLNDFMPMHMKYMHLVLIKKDLSHMAHVHPFYDAGSGMFNIPLNIATRHPDNFATASALPSAGEYAVFSEAKSKVYGMQIFRTDLKVMDTDGQLPGEWRQKLTLDEVSADGSIQKCADSTCDLQLQLQYDEIVGCGGNLVRFEFKVHRKDEHGQYVSDSKFQPWMMMGAHAILARDSGQMTRADYHHLHGQMPDEGLPAIMSLSVFNRGRMTESDYRMWIQFKSDDKVHSVPFTFHYTPKPVDPSCHE